jgi:hypothetical protein
MRENADETAEANAAKEAAKHVPQLAKIKLGSKLPKMLPPVKMLEQPKKDPLREYLRRLKSARG